MSTKKGNGPHPWESKSNPIAARSVPPDNNVVSTSGFLNIAMRPRRPHRSAADMSTCCAGVWGRFVGLDEGLVPLFNG